MPRLLKQLLYGTFYIVVLVGIAWWIYSWFFAPPPTCTDGRQNQGEQGIDCGGPCANICIPSTVRPIVISQPPVIFRSTPQGISILAEIQNPNPAYAAESVPYTFKIYGEGDILLREVSDVSYMYGGEIKYLGVFNLPYPSVQSVELAIGSPTWVPADSLKKPQVTIQNMQATTTAQGVEADGRFVNNDTVGLSNVTVFAVFYDSLGRPAGISKNEFLDVAPGDVQEFSVIYPLFPNPDLSKTAVFLYGKRPVLPSGNP